MNAFLSNSTDADMMNEAFEEWLIDTCTNVEYSTAQRQAKLIDWINAPYASFCHPRAEHLLPLHVCAGLTDTPAKLVFEGKVAGKKSCAFLW